MNNLNNINTGIINIDNSLSLKNINITEITQTTNSSHSSYADDNKLPTVQYLKDYVDGEDNNYAKLDEQNTFEENNTFKKNIIVQKYTNNTLTSSLTITGDSIDTTNSNNILNIKNSTIITNQEDNINKDTLQTNHIILDTLKLNTSNNITINDIIPTSDSTYTANNDKLITKGYFDEKTKDLDNYAKVNANNIFLENDTNNNPLSNTFNGNVYINKELSTSSGNLNIKSYSGTINLGNKSSNQTNLNTSSNVDTLTTDNITLNNNLIVNGTTTLGSKSTDKTTLITSSNEDILTTDKLSLRNNLIVNGTTTLNDDLTLTGDAILTGDITLGKKTSNQTTLITTSNIDTLTTDNIDIDKLKIKNSTSGTYNNYIDGIIGASNTPYTTDDTKLITKGYIDETLTNGYAKLNESNTFTEKNGNVDNINAFESIVQINKQLTTKSNQDLNITSSTKNIILEGDLTLGQKLTNQSSLITNTTTQKDTLTTDNITLRDNLIVNGTSTLTGDITLGQKTNNKSTIITDITLQKDTLTTDNLILNNSLSVNGTSTLTGNSSLIGDIILGQKTNNKSSLITDTTLQKDTLTTDNILLNENLTVKGNSTFGNKSTNQTTIITDTTLQTPEDTLTTDNVVIRNSLSINGELNANLPNKYNYAYLYDETNNYYTYNNINYVYDSTNHNFNVIGFRNNKNNTFIIEPYLLIEETINNNTELNKYPVIGVNNNFSYSVNNIDTYIYCPDNFDYFIIAQKILNNITSSLTEYNIYISVIFKYELLINTTFDDTTEYNTTLNFDNNHKKIYYIIRNPSFTIDINNVDVSLTETNKSELMHNYVYIGLIIPNNNLFIINLSNIHNGYLGYYTYDNDNTSYYNYQLTSNPNILKGKIIESHYNMYLMMSYNRLNYLSKLEYKNLLYIKQYRYDFEQPSETVDYLGLIVNDNYTKPMKSYIMNEYYNINSITFDNTNSELKIYIEKLYIDNGMGNLPTSHTSISCSAIMELKQSYTGYTLDDTNLLQTYFINNKIYILCKTTTNNNILLFIFDIDDYTYYKKYIFNNLTEESEYVIPPENILFNYNKENNEYTLFTLDKTLRGFKKLILIDTDEHNGKFFYCNEESYSIYLENETIIDYCYCKPYIILLTKITNSYDELTETDKYKLYYCQDLKYDYWQYLNITLKTLQSGNYNLDMGIYNIPGTIQRFIIKYIPKLYITHYEDVSVEDYPRYQFTTYPVDVLLMRI